MSYLDIFGPEPVPQYTPPPNNNNKKKPTVYELPQDNNTGEILPVLNEINPSILPEKKPTVNIIETKNENIYEPNNQYKVNKEPIVYTQLPQDLLNYFPELDNNPYVEKPDYTLYYIFGGFTLLILLYMIK